MAPQPHALVPVAGVRFALDPESLAGARSLAVIEHFDLALPASNPLLLDCFRDRNRAQSAATQFPNPQVPWAGEFVGKYLTHAAELYRLTRHSELRAVVTRVVKLLAKYQASDGYCGAWPDAHRFSTSAWDAWSHYHVQIGCLLWHDAASDPTALEIATKIASCLASTFTSAKQLLAMGSVGQNPATLHSMACLYTRTKDPKLLHYCHLILEQLQMPPCGDWLRNALAGKHFFKSTCPRWEGMCAIMGLAELYHATGDAQMRQAFEFIFWDLCELERHNHGGMMSNEQACGSPYNTGSVETCATVTWGALTVEMLKLTGNSVVADELELSALNSGLFLLSPSGRWCVYNSVMAGQRVSVDITGAGVNRPASSELFCCSCNGPRIMGLLSDWGVMALPDDNGYAINLFAAGSITVPHGSQQLTFEQETDYPLDPKVKLTVSPSGGAATFTLQIRVPCWSERTTIAVNSAPVSGVKPGSYCVINRAWQPDDVVDIKLDFRLPSNSPTR